MSSVFMFIVKNSQIRRKSKGYIIIWNCYTISITMNCWFTVGWGEKGILYKGDN